MPDKVIQCPNSIPCLGVDGEDGDFPIRNLSAELPDTPLFYCTVYTAPPPPLGVPCGSYSALAIAASVVSQADACELADLIAQEAACPPIGGGGGPIIDGAPPPITPPCTPGSCPSGQTCIEGECCPTPPPNDFGPVGINPRRPQAPIVIGELTPAKCCADTAYSGTITARGFSPFLWTVSAGLPPGLTFTTGPTSATITGNATSPGIYNFTVTVQASDGGIQTKLFTLRVVDITTPTPLPEGTASQAYSQTLNQVGGIPAISWQLSDGALPPGLSLDESTGIISGTPPALVGGQPNDGGTYTFTVSMQDEAT